MTKPLPQEAELREQILHKLLPFAPKGADIRIVESKADEIMQLITEYGRKELQKEIAWHAANLAYEVGYSGSPHAESERVAAEKRLAALSTPSEQPNRGKESK